MKAQFIKKINTIEQGCKVANQETDTAHIQDQRITELETRILYLEDTIESLNAEMAEISQQFSLAKNALQMMHKKLEQVSGNSDVFRNPADEPPPPHY